MFYLKLIFLLILNKILIYNLICEVKNMKHNESIACTVDECKYHCKEDNYCTLDQIKVVKHEGNARTVECTDCGSFESERL